MDSSPRPPPKENGRQQASTTGHQQHARTTSHTHPTSAAQENDHAWPIIRARWRRALYMTGELRAPVREVALLLLDEFANQKHFTVTGELEAWPSEARLAVIFRKHVSNIQKAISALEERRIIICVDRGGALAEPRHNNRYRFNSEWLDATEQALLAETFSWNGQQTPRIGVWSNTSLPFARNNDGTTPSEFATGSENAGITPSEFASINPREFTQAPPANSLRNLSDPTNTKYLDDPTYLNGRPQGRSRDQGKKGGSQPKTSLKSKKHSDAYIHIMIGRFSCPGVNNQEALLRSHWNKMIDADYDPDVILAVAQQCVADAALEDDLPPLPTVAQMLERCRERRDQEDAKLRAELERDKVRQQQQMERQKQLDYESDRDVMVDTLMDITKRLKPADAPTPARLGKDYDHWRKRRGYSHEAITAAIEKWQAGNKGLRKYIDMFDGIHFALTGEHRDADEPAETD